MQFRKSENAKKNMQVMKQGKCGNWKKKPSIQTGSKNSLDNFGRHGTQRLPTEKKITEKMQPTMQRKKGEVGGERKRKEHRPARR